MQLLGSARERPRVRDLHKRAQLPQFHHAIVCPQLCEGQTLNTSVIGAIAHRLSVGGAGAPTVGGVTATTVNRWAGTFAAKAPPESFFAISAVFHYLGPAFAVLLFARVEVLGVAWLRIASAALIFAVWRRPWRAFAALDRDGRRC